jgi:predicted transcriptional regulator of viral defense system
MIPKAGIEAINRQYLDAINRRIQGPFSPCEAEKVLGFKRKRLLRLLAYLASRGWLKRVRRGLYIPVPLGTIDPSGRTGDPWAMALRVFAPCYIGGWSACEYWGFTDQIFNDILVISRKRVRKKEQKIQQFKYIVRFVSQYRFFGTQTIWREQERILISDPSKTIVDALDCPGIVGGGRHLTQVVSGYFNSEHRSDEQLAEYLRIEKNRVAYKRLGYIMELTGVGSEMLTKECLKCMGNNISFFDPVVKTSGIYLKRWRLRINVAPETGAET